MIRKLLKTPVSLLIFTALGIATGIFMTPLTQFLNFPGLPALLASLGSWFLFLLELAILPWLFTSISLSLSSLIQSGHGPKHIGKSFLIFGCLLFIIAAVGIGASMILSPGAHMQASSLDFMGKAMQNFDSSLLFSGDLLNFTSATFPGSLILIPLLVILGLAVVFGFAVGSTSERSFENLNLMLQSLHEAFQKIISGVLYALPLGLFFFAAATFPIIRDFPFTAFPLLFILLGAATLLFVAAGFIVVWLRSGKSFFTTLLAFTEPLLTVLLSAEVIAALPSGVSTLEKKLGFDTTSVGLNMPFGLSAIKYGQILINVITVSFLLQVYGISLDLPSLVGLFISAVIAALLSIGPGTFLAPALLSFPLAFFGVPDKAVLPLYAMAAFLSPLSSTLTLMLNAGATALACKPIRKISKSSTTEMGSVRLRDDFDDEIVLQKDESPVPDYSVTQETWLPLEEPLSVQTLRIIVPQKEVKPFLFQTKEGIPDGIDIRLIREIATRLGKKVIIEQEDLSQSQMFERLRNGQSDIAAGRILEKGSMGLGIVFSGPYASVQENGERLFTVLALAPGMELSSNVNSIIKELTGKQFVNKVLASMGGK